MVQCYPCPLPSFGCSVAAVWFPPVRSCRTDPLHLAVVWCPRCSCGRLVGCLGNSVFLLVLLQKCYISEMKYVLCMSNGMGRFPSSPGSPQAWHIACWRAAKGKHLGGKKKKKILRRQLPEFGARLIRTPHCLSETNVLIKSIVVGLDGTKCYWVTS